MKCSECNQDFASLKLFFSHLRQTHYFKDGPILCTVDNCNRTFSNINSFRKHLKTKHTECDTIQDVPSEACLNHNVPTHDVDQNTNATICTDAEAQILREPIEDSELPIENFNYSILSFVSYLYTNNSIPRSEVQNIIDLVTKLFRSEFIVKVHSKVISALMENTKTDEDTLRLIQNAFEKMENPFADFSSEYKRFKYFESSGNFKPQEIIFGENTALKTVRCDTVMVNSTAKYVFIPLRDSLKKLFELPMVLQKTIRYLSSLTDFSDIKQNFVQGELWRSKQKQFGGKLVFPIFIYFDDFEVGDVLGSHAGTNKLGAVYASIPCFPPEFQSLTESIILVQLFKSHDRTSYGNNIFQKVIEELNHLFREGISVTDGKGHTEKIYFALGLCIGDNLGLNSILGYTECFNASYFCRFCKMSKTDTVKALEEDASKLRNPVNYEIDLTTRNMASTGLKEECVWNSVESFHVTENLSVDIMHDLLEGVCNYDLCLILNHFIYDLEYFSLETLNAKIESFDYGSEKNPPPKISGAHLRRQHIKMSSSEMLCFVTFFGLMFGHFVPKSDSYWQLYLLLCKILEIVLDKSFHPHYPDLLASLISEHHYIYHEVLKQSLKPKYHNMVHYPRIMKMVGPLVHIWSMRFESRHRPFKISANTTSSRKNICLTLAIKCQLQFCHRSICHKGFRTKIAMGPSEFIETAEYTYADFVAGMADCVEVVKWVKIQGIIYRRGDVIAISVSDDECLPIFGKILDLLVLENEIKIIYRLLLTKGIEEHLNAFVIENMIDIKIICSKDLKHVVKYCLNLLPDGKYYIVRKHGI